MYKCSWYAGWDRMGFKLIGKIKLIEKCHMYRINNIALGTHLCLVCEPAVTVTLTNFVSFFFFSFQFQTFDSILINWCVDWRQNIKIILRQLFYIRPLHFCFSSANCLFNKKKYTIFKARYDVSLARNILSQ